MIAVSNIWTFAISMYSYIERTNKWGNPRKELCFCRECSEVGLFIWLLYIDHSPLRCRYCEAFAVERVQDNVFKDRQAIYGIDRKAEQDLSGDVDAKQDP